MQYQDSLSDWDICDELVALFIEPLVISNDGVSRKRMSWSGQLRVNSAGLR